MTPDDQEDLPIFTAWMQFLEWLLPTTESGKRRGSLPTRAERRRARRNNPSQRSAGARPTERAPCEKSMR
jgi:hypothetical protein